MLQFRKQKSLAAQAMHELGNIMFHSGNIRFVNSTLLSIAIFNKSTTIFDGLHSYRP